MIKGEFTVECKIDVKHEGKTLAYQVKLNDKLHEAVLPEWEFSSANTEEQEVFP